MKLLCQGCLQGLYGMAGNRERCNCENGVCDCRCGGGSVVETLVQQSSISKKEEAQAYGDTILQQHGDLNANMDVLVAKL